MTKFQKLLCVFLCLCFFMVLVIYPGPFSMWKRLKNVYRQFPLCFFVEKEAEEAWKEADQETLNEIMEKNGEYLREKKGEEAALEAEMETTGENQQEGGSRKEQKTQDAQNEEKGQTEEKERKRTENTQTEEMQELDKLQADKDQNQTELQITAPAVEIQGNSLPETPHPLIDLSSEKLADYDFLLRNFYIVDENTDDKAVTLDAASFLAEDFSLKKEVKEPQILIYHSHSQETFQDSREGERADTIVGVGDYLEKILTEKYGYQVLHITEAFDMMSGELDRSKAYDYACDYVEKVLEENPSIEVVIDLHRDGIDENRRLVTEINGKPTAQLLFYNGLSYTKSQGKVFYLPNPYIQDNLAFSFQLEYQAALYYPTLYRGIYLAGLRYNLHLKKRALLLEAGAQTNTVQEVKNAMEPFADILNRVLERV